MSLVWSGGFWIRSGRWAMPESGLIVFDVVLVMSEWDKSHALRFDWDEISRLFRFLKN